MVPANVSMVGAGVMVPRSTSFWAVVKFGESAAIDAPLSLLGRLDARPRPRHDHRRRDLPHRPPTSGCAVQPSKPALVAVRVTAWVSPAARSTGVVGPSSRPFSRVRPERRVDWRAVGTTGHVAEEVLLHTVLGEVIAFEVEEDVVGGGLGEKRQAVLGVEGLSQLVIRRASLASDLLRTRLLPDPYQCLP